MRQAAIDKAVFPGTQGGPLMHIIAAKAVASEALTDEVQAVSAEKYSGQRVRLSKARAGPRRASTSFPAARTTI